MYSTATEGTGARAAKLHFTEFGSRILPCHSFCNGQDLDQLLRRLPSNVVYNFLPAVPIDEDTPTIATQRQADALFNRIRQAPSYKRSKETTKRRDWERLFHASTVAIFLNGCIRYPRNRTRIKGTMLQVIDCAVEAGLFVGYRSPPGSPKMSRLIPLSPLRGCVSRDPRAFDPPSSQRLVQLFTREDKPVEIGFDPDHPVAADVQRRLELINQVNSRCEITFTPYDPWVQDFVRDRRLRPVHRARFTERWDWHGRLYTGRYGHQALRKIERRTIKFDGEPSVELDYSGMHTRLLYHRLGLEFPGDPYALWGASTTEPQRLLAKTVMNATINAGTLNSALSACNGKTRPKGDSGRWKQGSERERARLLLDALQETRLRFQEVQDLVIEFHRPIAGFFGCDMGMRLMRTDSAIALDVLSHFAERGSPALGVHDSFIVPQAHQEELRSAMTEYYRRQTGHLPVVK